jgi:hypothetical protein
VTRGRVVLGAVALALAMLARPFPSPSAEERQLRAKLEAFTNENSFGTTLNLLDDEGFTTATGLRPTGIWGLTPPLLELWFPVGDGSEDCLVLRRTPARSQVDRDAGCRHQPRLL